jgi:apolipoprotein N-acyltransferase
VAEPGRRLALLGGYAALTFLSFPQPLGGRVLDLGPWLGWLGPALLVLGLEGVTPKRGAALGFLASWVAHSAILHWIYVVTVVYGHAPVVVGVLAPLALALYIAAFGAALGAGIAWLGRAGPPSPFAVAALWAVLDHLRTFVLTGFPWALLGYAQHGNPVLVGLAPYTGVYGLSFVTALGGAALAHAVRMRGLRPAAAVALGVVLLAHVPGWLSGDETPPGTPRVRVAVLQGNIDQGVKWAPDWFARTLETYEDLSRRAAARGAEWIVWPESALPIALDAPHAEPVRARLSALARETGAELVVGSVGVGTASDGRITRWYDSAFLLDASGGFRDRYDKAHLVPFGEYVPFQDLLGRMLRAVARGIAEVRASPGPGPRPLRMNEPEGRASPPVWAGVPICYELIFPDLMRRFVRDGAGILLGITNDAWYGRTGAPFQFLAITAMRSAENRVWTARAANTGVSAFIDARGRIRSRTQIFERDLLVEDVPYRPPPLGGSFYTRHGDVFVAACWMALAVLGWRARTRSRHDGDA